MRSAQKRIDFDTDSPPSGMLIGEGEWESTPQSVRREISRAHYELSNGLAIAKDRRCGRDKNDLDGFYGLHRAEHKLAMLKAAGQADASLESSIREMQARLADDEKRITEMDALDEWHRLAAAGGTDIATALQAYVGIESDLRQSVEAFKTKGETAPLVQSFIRIADMAGHDGLQVVHQFLQNTLSGERAEA